VFIAGLVGGGIAVIDTSRPEASPLLVTACFISMAGVQLWSFSRGIPAWVEGRTAPMRTQMVQLAIFLGSFAFFLLGGHPGLAAILGAFVGLFAMTPVTRVLARRNRAVVDAAWAARPQSTSKSTSQRSSSRRTTGRRPRVGHALAVSLASSLTRATAWAVATVVGCVMAVAGSAWLDRGDSALAITFAVGLFCVGLPLREMWGVHRARRAYDSGRRSPRIGWVALLHDPNPRVYRPLLAIWDEEPISGPGTFPKPDRVFRADDESDALLSYQTAMSVHEAWIDGVEGRWATPRWVAADEGIAIPHRRAILGRWYFGAITSAERAEAEPLSLDEPNPQLEPVAAESPSGFPGLKAMAWRSGLLSALALGWALLLGT